MQVATDVYLQWFLYLSENRDFHSILSVFQPCLCDLVPGGQWPSGIDRKELIQLFPQEINLLRTSRSSPISSSTWYKQTKKSSVMSRNVVSDVLNQCKNVSRQKSLHHEDLSAYAQDWFSSCDTFALRFSVIYDTRAHKQRSCWIITLEDEII